MTVVADIMVTKYGQRYNIEHIKAAAVSYYHKLMSADSYTPACKLEQQILLIKADQSVTTKLGHDFRLSDICDDVVVKSSIGNHYTFIVDGNSASVSDIIMEWLESH